MIRNRIKNISIAISLLFFICFAVVKAEAQVAASAAVDSTHMMIGDHMKLHLSIQYPPQASIQNVDYTGFETDEHIELINNGDFDTIQSGNLTVLQKDLLFSIYDSGSFNVPPIKVEYARNGRTETTSTFGIPIEVMTPTRDSLYLAPNKDIIEEPLNWQDLMPYFLVVLSIILLVGIILFFVNRKKKKVIPPPPPRLVPAHDIANEKLIDLKSKQLWQNGEVKAYQSQLTYIVREYLENRYNTQALESTTSEILDQLKSLKFDDAMKAELQEMLQLADMVKFAKADPPPEAHERLMKYAESFVEKTKPVLTEEGYKEGLVKLPPLTAGGEAIAYTNLKSQNSNVVPVSPIHLTESERFVKAGFWRRFFAHTIDANLFTILLAILLAIIGLLIGFDMSNPMSPLMLLFITVGYFLFGFYYFAYQHAVRKQTVGKRLLGIEVINQDGQNLSKKRAALRMVIKFISIWPFLGLPFLSVFFTKKKQGLHDILSKSIVIKKNESSRMNDILDD